MITKFEKHNESLRDKMTPKSLDDIWIGIENFDGIKLANKLAHLMNNIQRDVFWDDKKVMYEILSKIDSQTLGISDFLSIMKTVDQRLAYGTIHILVGIYEKLDPETRKVALQQFRETMIMNTI